MGTRTLTRLRGPLAIGSGALLLWTVVGVGFANYDTLYALVWGQQIARGETPSYGLAIAPTPHPLVEGLGVLLAPLGASAAETIVVALAYLSLAALGYLVYRLASEWFCWQAGALAAALLLTREPVISYGIRAYVDVPYVALALCALLVETRRPRAGTPVLAILALAGLLRPEAWLLSGAYWLYLVVAGERDRLRLARLALIVASAPLLWALSDLLVTGDPLWSLTKTQSTAQTLQRTRGLANVPVTGARRLGEILRPDGLLAAATGGLLALWLLRARALPGVIAGLVAAGALAVLAAPGLPIDTRYVFLPAALLAIFAGAGVFGWIALEHDHPRRRAWQLVAAGLAFAIAGFAPSQASRVTQTIASLASQQQIEADLRALSSNACLPIGVPNHRPLPLLALYRNISPATIDDAQVHTLAAGSYFDPANSQVARDYTLDKNDPHPLTASVPSGFSLSAANRSWRLYTRCEPTTRQPAARGSAP